MIQGIWISIKWLPQYSVQWRCGGVVYIIVAGGAYIVVVCVLYSVVACEFVGAVYSAVTGGVAMRYGCYSGCAVAGVVAGV